MMNLDSIVKINYILDIPFNDSLKKEYHDFLDDTGRINDGYKNHIIEKLFKESVKDLIDGVRKEYPTFDGKFVLELRNDRVKGIFKSSYQVKGSMDEPLRREFFERFKKLTNSDDLRVEINLNCMI